MDLRKNFDKVPHNSLMWKLKKVGGVSGKLAHWMEIYLLQREMLMVVRGRIGVERIDQWSAAGVSAWSHYIFDLCQLYARRNRQFYEFVCG